MHPLIWAALLTVGASVSVLVRQALNANLQRMTRAPEPHRRGVAVTTESSECQADIYLALSAILIVLIAGLLIWRRSGWTISPLGRQVSKEILWVSCQCWGFLLMISAATEGLPNTSIDIRGDLVRK